MCLLSAPEREMWQKRAWILETEHYEYLSHQPDDESIVVGMTNGILSIKHRKSLNESKEVSSQQRRRPTYRVFVKGKNYVPKQVTQVDVGLLIDYLRIHIEYIEYISI